MNKFYQVEMSNYDGSTCYGSFEDKKLADDLLSEVNSFFKSNNIDEEAFIRTVMISNEKDVMYKYVASLDIKNKNDIKAEAIVPTYLPYGSGLTMEYIKERMNEGHGMRCVRQYGATKEDAVNAVMNFYKELEKENLIAPLIKLIDLHDKKYAK